MDAQLGIGELSRRESLCTNVTLQRNSLVRFTDIIYILDIARGKIQLGVPADSSIVEDLERITVKVLFILPKL